MLSIDNWSLIAVAFADFFQPISRLFTEQPLCRLSYAASARKLAQACLA